MFTEACAAKTVVAHFGEMCPRRRDELVARFGAGTPISKVDSDLVSFVDEHWRRHGSGVPLVVVDDGGAGQKPRDLAAYARDHRNLTVQVIKV